MLTGDYSYRNGNWDPEKSFCVQGANQSAVLTKAIDGMASVHTNNDGYFIVSGYMIGQNNFFYYYQFNGEAVIFDDTQSVSEIESEVEGKSYDILGRPVSDDYKGIVIRGGKKYMVR